MSHIKSFQWRSLSFSTPQDSDDNMHFLYYKLDTRDGGDFQATTFIHGITPNSQQAFTGLMIRGELTTNSYYAAILVSHQQDYIRMYYRNYDGNDYNQWTSRVTLPNTDNYFLRLAKEGNEVRSYFKSEDAAAWSYYDSEVIDGLDNDESLYIGTFVVSGELDER